MSDVPENDALEQAQEVVPAPPAPELDLDLEVPEADALEQAQEVPAAEEDYEA